jgi:K+/H+ antiporter YhaU regulatory subunit KhtT
MIVEDFRRRTEREKAEKYEQKPEAVPPSVAEILVDPAYSELLNLALEKEKDPQKKGLLQKILEGRTLEEQDFKNLESYRQLIKEATEYSREITQRLTPETIKIIADASPEFNNLVAQIGINKVKDFLEAYLARLYVIDKTSGIDKPRFNDLADKIKAIKEAEQKLQEIDKSLREVCRKYGISESELAQIYERVRRYKDTQTDEDIQTLVYKEIQPLVYGRLNLLERIQNLLRGGELIGERVNELNKIIDIQTSIEAIHENLTAVGKMIADVVFGTQEGRTFLSKALSYGQIENVGGGISFREAASFYSGEDLKREWEEYVREVTKKGGKFQGQDPNDKKVKRQLRRGFVEHLRRNRFGNRMGGVIDVLIGMVENLVANNK